MTFGGSICYFNYVVFKKKKKNTVCLDFEQPVKIKTKS